MNHIPIGMHMNEWENVAPTETSNGTGPRHSDEKFVVHFLRDASVVVESYSLRGLYIIRKHVDLSNFL